MGSSKDSMKTRAKLIAAAGELFAEMGFSAVTVRDIAKKAETQISALNYHFGSKEALYREVLLEACRENSFTPEQQQQLCRLDPRQSLHVIISESIKRYQAQSESNWQSSLIACECWQPSAVFKEIAEAYFKPQADFVADMIGRIVNRSADDSHVRFAVVGLIGLLDTFGQYGQFIDAVAPGLNAYLENHDQLASQLVSIVVQMATGSTES